MTATVTPIGGRTRVVASSGPRDLEAATDAAAAMMRALGVDPDDPARPDLALTPVRLAKAYADLLTPDDFDMTTFENVEEYDEMVLVRDIPMQSVCEHHLLPFIGGGGLTSPIYPRSGSLACRSWRALWATSQAAPRHRSG